MKKLYTIVLRRDFSIGEGIIPAIEDTFSELISNKENLIFFENKEEAKNYQKYKNMKGKWFLGRNTVNSNYGLIEILAKDLGRLNLTKKEVVFQRNDNKTTKKGEETTYKMSTPIDIKFVKHVGLFNLKSMIVTQFSGNSGFGYKCNIPNTKRVPTAYLNFFGKNKSEWFIKDRDIKPDKQPIEVQDHVENVRKFFLDYTKNRLLHPLRSHRKEALEIYNGLKGKNPAEVLSMLFEKRESFLQGNPKTNNPNGSFARRLEYAINILGAQVEENEGKSLEMSSS